MSYSRFSYADVYVFMSASGHLECCGCILQEREWVDDPSWPIFGGYLQAVEPIIEYRFDSTQTMVDHLAAHRAAGHNVPDGIEAELWADDRENWVPICLECAAPLPDTDDADHDHADEHDGHVCVIWQTACAQDECPAWPRVWR